MLAPSGSAPGVDGEPCEVCHFEVRFVACLIAQGMYAAGMSDTLLDAVLGPSIDLLVWIPRAPVQKYLTTYARCNSRRVSVDCSALPL